MAETMKFGAEIGKVLHLMIHSLYTNKDIFLRELISNASDACDKLRYLSLTNHALSQEANNPKIKIISNLADRTLTIADNGIGMNKAELIENIGTIASSGTQKFINQLTGDNKKDVQLIGQFGVGFYSSFMVADKVTVITKKAGEEIAYKWISDGQGEFTIEEIDHAEIGTSIILHLKEGDDQYLDKFRIEHIVKTYSDHISLPIEFSNENEAGEILNDASALWTKPKSEITEEQYKLFYKQVAFAPDSPWLTLHNKNEGNVEFTNLLFIPSKKPFDLFHPDRVSRVKLYVKRVFITEENVNLIPAHMRFLRGIIDSEDLPLNISRETLQHNNIIDKIRKSISKKVVNELKKKLDNDRENYEEFWNNFGAVLKEGLCEALDNQTREDLMQICLFKSAITDKLVTLEEYIAQMKPEQKAIYHFNGEDSAKLKNSPQLEGFLKAGIDVLLFTDNVDDFWVNVEPKFKDTEIKSVTRAGIDLENLLPKEDDEESKSEEAIGNNAKLIEFFKSTLGPVIADVKISGKLVDSPVCLAANEGAMDIRMERFLKEQKQLVATSAKILEFNPKHSIIKQLASLIENNNEQAGELAWLLFDQACIVEGESINDTGDFLKRFNKFLGLALS